MTDINISSSPARNMGSVILAPEIDFTGISVPQETNPTIGVYEYIA